MKDSHRRLREGTRAEHERLDTLFAGYDLADRASYAAFLAAHAAAVLPVEAVLDAADIARLVLDWPERRRGDALAADLAALDHPLPPPATLPAFANDAALLGAIYVLEGSRLGGRFLSRQLGEGFPRAYLDSEQAPGAWAKLLAKLDALLYAPRDWVDAIEGARATFAIFEVAGRRWLPRVS